MKKESSQPEPTKINHHRYEIDSADFIPAGTFYAEGNDELTRERILAIQLVEEIGNQLAIEHPEINEISLFHGNYVGNYYEILFLPDKFSFEVIEAYMSGSVWNPLSAKINFSQDFERFSGRKYHTT